MEKYILSFEDRASFNAGLKAPQDCEKILLQKGYQKICIPLFHGGNKIINKAKNFLKYTVLFHLKSESVIVVQHPQYISGLYMDFLKWVKRLKRCSFIFIIHDLESLRCLFIENQIRYQKIDKKMYEIGDIMIAHNEKMKKYMVEQCNVPEGKIVVLHLFDYLSENIRQFKTDDVSKDDGVIIAGNLHRDKTGYIYKLTQLHTHTKFNLYGVNWDKQENEHQNWEYKGSFTPEELPKHLEGAFGLVWDGDSTQICNGAAGKYVQYNNPHKVSLYIASGIPVLIWEKAAMAEFVTENQIGVALDNLNCIDEVIEKITEEEYHNMRENIQKISERVRRGDYISEAIMEAEKRLSQ